MKKSILVLSLAALVASCGGKEKKEKEEGFEMAKPKTEKKEAPKEAEKAGVPEDLSNKGIGPISSVDISGDVDADLAKKGEEIFGVKCVACHMVDQRMIGPAIKGVTQRRSPEWIMNMIMNPSQMIKEDPIAKALLEEYNNAIMLDQQIPQEEARALLEYFRTL